MNYKLHYLNRIYKDSLWCFDLRTFWEDLINWPYPKESKFHGNIKRLHRDAKQFLEDKVQSGELLKIKLYDADHPTYFKWDQEADNYMIAVKLLVLDVIIRSEEYVRCDGFYIFNRLRDKKDEKYNLRMSIELALTLLLKEHKIKRFNTNKFYIPNV